MLIPIFSKAFEKDLERSIKRGFDASKLKNIITELVNNRPLSEKYRLHKLKGNFVGYWECHITPDWILIYKKDNDKIYFVRTGTHSDLF